MFYRKLNISSDEFPDSGRVRYYRLSEPVLRGVDGLGGHIELTVDSLFKSNEFRAEYQYLNEELKKPVRFVCVSDAKTHTERLVFACVFDHQRNCPVMLRDCICGKNTFIIDGGNPRHVYGDITYLRWLAGYNGYEWGGQEF